VERVRGSYALKLALALVSVVALTVAVGALVQAQTNEQLRDDVEGDLTTVAQSQAGTLDTWLSNVKRQTRVTSRHPAVASGDVNRTRTVLSQLVEDDGVPDGVVAVHHYDADERIIVTSSSDEFVGVNPARQNVPFATYPPSFDGSDDVHVSEPFRTSITDFPVVAVMSPVPDRPDERIIYMVNIEERTQSLTGTVEAGSTLVLDSAGRYLVHSDTDQLLTARRAGGDDPVVERGLAGETGFREGSDGMLLAYAPIEAADWVVVVRVPESEAFALGATVTSNIVGLILISVVSLALIGVTVGSNTVISLRQLSRRADNMAGGDLDVELETNRTDEFGTLYGSFARMRDSLRDQIREVERAREESEQAREEAERAREDAEDAREEAEQRRERAEELSNHLEAKASHYQQAMDAVGDGDLTVRVDPESRNDAMTAIGESLNDTLAEVERTVASVKRFAAHVSNSVAEVETAAEDAMATGEEVDGSMTEISEGAARQTERLGEALDEMNTLSATAEEIAATVDEVARTSEQAAQAGDVGREAAEEAVAELDAIEEVTTRTAAEIEELEREVAAIGEVVEVISDIAEQTNMLALNASIEAARADVEGDGFAVVADEVKELAEETQASAAEIEDRIERVQSKTAESVEGVTETSERVDAGVDTVEGAIEALEEIVEYVEETDASITEISDATDEQAKSATAVVDTVEDVANISEETTSRAETASDATATQTEQLASVQGDAGDLADRAAELSRLLDDFRVAQGAGPTDEADPDAPEVSDS